ncbi:MAG: MFS transporter [Cardiobacteriaceae bacterium]|nr:MFS transporter [Cardiobacteriaceae bacterium]
MLLFSRRFGPFFLTQFGGAFVDNYYKNALLVFMTLHLSGQTLSLYANLAMALFILPFFIFSAWSGLLADGREKRHLILRIKLMEIAIIATGILAFWLENVWLMLAVIFFLGLQSTFFGPVKYAMLPERLAENELMLGNGLIEAGTFIAIILGMLLGSYFYENARAAFYVFMALATLGGFAIATFIPRGDQPTDTPLPPFRPWRQTVALLKDTAREKTIYQCILAISWFWLLGTALMTQIPLLTKEYLLADNSVMIYLLALFSVGIGAGSLLANVLARGRVEPGLVPFGAFLVAAGMFAFICAIPGKGEISRDALMPLAAFFHADGFFRITFAVLLIAVASGIYVVPLYAVIQARAAKGKKAQVIAANNIINSLFMVAVSLLSILVLSVLGRSIGELVALLLALHIAISLYIFKKVPEFILRLIVLVITRIFYRVRFEGREHLPDQGAAVLICNHVSYLDAFLLMAACRRPIRFIMYYKIFDIPVLKQVFRLARAIPIAARHESAAVFRQAFIDAETELGKGHIVGIFPEGGLTRDGEVAPFKGGVNLILAKTPVPVIPVAISHMWGSFFSHSAPGAFRGFRGLRHRVTVRIGAPLPADSSVETLRATVLSLRDEK